jgi:hypothetical protein
MGKHLSSPVTHTKPTKKSEHTSHITKRASSDDGRVVGKDTLADKVRQGHAKGTRVSGLRHLLTSLKTCHRILEISKRLGLNITGEINDAALVFLSQLGRWVWHSRGAGLPFDMIDLVPTITRTHITIYFSKTCTPSMLCFLKQNAELLLRRQISIVKHGRHQPAEFGL